MKQSDINTVRKIAEALEDYNETLTNIQDNEQSEALDQAIDDLAMTIDDLYTAIEE